MDERTPAVHDGYALASLVLSLLWLAGVGSVLAVIFGHLSEQGAKRQGRKVSAFAAAGQVLGVAGIVGIVVLVARSR